MKTKRTLKILKLNFIPWLGVVFALWLISLFAGELATVLHSVETFPLWGLALLNVLGRGSTTLLSLFLILAILAMIGKLVKAIAPFLSELFALEEVSVGETEVIANDFSEAVAITETARQLECSLEAARRERSRAGKHLTDAREYSLHLGRLIKAFALQSLDYASEGEKLAAVLQALKTNDREALALAAAQVDDSVLRELILTRAGTGFQSGLVELIAHQMGSLHVWGERYDQLTGRLLSNLTEMKGRLLSLEAVYSATEIAEPVARVQTNLDQAMLHLSPDARPGGDLVRQTLPRISGRLLKV